MEKFVTSPFRVGIAGGGQLGRMLALKAATWDVLTHCLDGESAPAHIICETLHKGSITEYDDVVRFGKNVDVVTIESDNVNVEALKHLEGLGKKVCPSAAALKVIQDKGLQRQFCSQHGIPVPAFKVYADKGELLADPPTEFPCIVKTRKAGYDGKGVFLVDSAAELEELPDVGLVVEQKVDIEKELTIIVVRNGKGEVAFYPCIELFMKQGAYLVDYLISPADIPQGVQQQAEEMARSLADALEIEGLLAIELFLDTSGTLLVNECSPRPHDSGHQTIEGSYTCQYENHLRGILNLPLGSCAPVMHAAMVNLLGEADARGPVKYENLTECLSIQGVNVHIYGKKEVTPFRKMGHITILNPSYDDLLQVVDEVKRKVKVRA